MYLFSPDYDFSRARMDERLKHAESGRRANERRADEVRGAGQTQPQRVVTILGPAGRRAGGAGAPHLRLLK